MWRAVKDLIQAILGLLGYRLVSLYSPAPEPPPDPLRRFLGLLRRQGFRPERVFDVGAHTGSWTRRALEFFPDAHYTLIEPQAELREHVEDLVDAGHRIEWLPVGAGEESGARTFTVSPRSDSSTFLAPHWQADDPRYRTVEVEVRTLDEIVRESGSPPPELVKIDAEGYDVRVLAGASGLLGKTEIFLLEAAVVAGNPENAFANVVGAMAEAGYRLIDITDLNRSPRDDALWLCELAFVLQNSSLLDGLDRYE